MVTGVAVFGATLAGAGAASSPPAASALPSRRAGRSPASAARRCPRRAARAAPAFHPTRLTHLGDARQVVVVTADDVDDELCDRADLQQEQQRLAPAVRADDARASARHGFAHFGERRQDSGETPAGTYALSRAFGCGARPGDGAALSPVRPQRLVALRPPRPAHVQRGAVPRPERGDAVAQVLGRAPVALPATSTRTRSCSTTTCRPGCTRPATSGSPPTRPTPRAGGGIFLHVNGPGLDRGVRVSGPEGACARSSAGSTPRSIR